uniref:Uncharacterized protein n=1 Tax=Anguilla anguilla TaxID=7936 RepID=A0A0E9SUV3_ANGAN
MSMSEHGDAQEDLFVSFPLGKRRAKIKISKLILLECNVCDPNLCRS